MCGVQANPKNEKQNEKQNVKSNTQTKTEPNPKVKALHRTRPWDVAGGNTVVASCPATYTDCTASLVSALSSPLATTVIVPATPRSVWPALPMVPHLYISPCQWYRTCISRRSNSQLLFHGVVSVTRCVLPYKHRTILEH